MIDTVETIKALGIKAVIFDLDGTLIDSLEDLAHSVNHGLERLGLPRHSVEDYRLKVGNGVRMLISRSLPPARQDQVDALLELHRNYYHEHFADKSRPYPGIFEALKLLQADGLKLGVLSNKGHEFTQKVVTATLGGVRFDTVSGHRDEYALKPDPASTLNVIERWQVRPEQVAFVGDSCVDMQTACGAGCFGIGAAWGYRGKPELIRHGARAIVESPGQIPALIRHLNTYGVFEG